MRALFIGNELHGTAVEVSTEVVKITVLGIEYVKQLHVSIGDCFYMVMVSIADLNAQALAESVDRAKELFAKNPIVHTDVSLFCFSED